MKFGKNPATNYSKLPAMPVKQHQEVGSQLVTHDVNKPVLHTAPEVPVEHTSVPSEVPVGPVKKDPVV